MTLPKEIMDFLKVYDDWETSEDLCAGPLFDAMLEAREILREGNLPRAAPPNTAKKRAASRRCSNTGRDGASSPPQSRDISPCSGGFPERALRDRRMMNLDDLEAEYMAAAAAGQYKAIDFAFGESDEFCAVVTMEIMCLLRLTAPETTINVDPDVALSVWARSACAHLLNVMEKHAAPQWAAAEYQRRREENLEMQAEWEQSEFPEITR